MQEDSKYFEKTAEALKNLHTTLSELNTAADNQIQNNTLLKARTAELRQEISTKITRIDNIIKTLNGAIQ